MKSLPVDKTIWRVMPIEYENLSSILQMAISPVILISACGLLLLSMTNRLGRVIDRARLLGRESTGKRSAQIAILRTRVRMIRSAIFLNAFCMLCTATIILTIFASAILGVALFHAVVILFALAVLSLIASLIFFMLDISRSLDAMEADMQGL